MSHKWKEPVIETGPQEIVQLGRERFLSSTNTLTTEDLAAAVVARRYRLCLPLARVVCELAHLGGQL